MAFSDLFAHPRIAILNVLTGEHFIVRETPFQIGSAEDCDLRLDSSDVSPQHCVFHRKGRKIYLLPGSSGGEIVFNGSSGPGGEVPPSTDHSLRVGSFFFAVRVDGRPERWLQSIDLNSWVIAEQNTAGRGGYSLPEVVSILRNERAIDSIILGCSGLTIGFNAEQVFPVIDALFPPVAGDSATQESFRADGTVAEINTEYGDYTCPVCWLKFDRGDVMHIAVHGSLRGDPVLGEDAMQRFHATRFNDRGQALDPMGIPAGDSACPHCRRKLAPGFLDSPHYIFSIVGAPSSGKSYYLSVLVKILATTLFKSFGVTFRDADPAANVLLNQMKSQLFSAGTAAEAQLAKTQLEGGMYEKLPRLGRPVSLPKPFIFQLSRAGDADEDLSVVFYDNAGEHFEPGRNSADSPGAQHVTAASAIFFLFDPLHNSEFRSRLSGVPDPQLQDRRSGLDQQDIILSETEVRMKSLLGMDSRRRVSTPLAVIIGKCDAWLQLLDGSQLENPISAGELRLKAIQRNSERLRSLLHDVCPSIVANAEAISDNVVYFAASSLGCAPEVIGRDPESGTPILSPDPKKIAPIHIEVPTLWALSQIAPQLVPSSTKDDELWRGS